MKGIFVTGTDTGVGKTVVAGLLGRFFSEQEHKVITQKWIQTGSNKFSPDISLHLKLMKRRRQDIKDYLSYVSPYAFKFASSPHLASSLEKKTIKAGKIKASFKFLAQKFDLVIVEGAGGALVPFSKKKMIIDVAGELGLPVLIVASNKLGAINHTLLTIEAIKKRRMEVAGVIFNNQQRGGKDIILRDNYQIVRSLSKEAVLGVLPWSKDKDWLYEKFIPSGRKILSYYLLKQRAAESGCKA